jgi:trypsin
MRSSTTIALAFCLSLLATATVCGCEEEDPATVVNNGTFQGIVGGEETDYKFFKGVIALYYQASATNGMICTATLIDPQVLITAGHCVYYPSEEIDAVAEPNKLFALGGANLDSPITYPFVEEVVKHPEWPGELGFDSVDLAMVKLMAPITTIETYRIRPEDDFEVDDTGVIVGYGLESSSLPNSAGVHRWGETTVQTKISHFVNLGDPAGTCQGDSGGPFFTMIDDYYYVTGVTSLGLSGTCDPMNGNVDQNVPQEYAWIDETMNYFMGYGLADVPHQDPPEDTDTGSDADTDSDTGTDTGTDADTDAVADAGADAGESEGADEGCGCSAAGVALSPRSLLFALLF